MKLDALIRTMRAAKQVTVHATILGQTGAVAVDKGTAIRAAIAYAAESCNLGWRPDSEGTGLPSVETISNADGMNVEQATAARDRLRATDVPASVTMTDDGPAVTL